MSTAMGGVDQSLSLKSSIELEKEHMVWCTELEILSLMK